MDAWLGVWRRIGLRPEPKTHLVVERDRLWDVWPGRVYTERDPGPEAKYVLRARGAIWEIDIETPTGLIAGLLAVEGGRLRLTRSHDDRRPATLDDVIGGACDVYERENDEATVARLRSPVARVARISRRHGVFGELTFDPNLSFWSGRIAAGTFAHLGVRAIDVDLALPEDASDADFDETARTFGGIELAAALAKASEELLDVYNTGWREWEEEGQDHEGPILDAPGFESRLTLASISLDEDGAVSLGFDDGALFWGHSVVVALDRDLVPQHAAIAG